jgi:thiamine-monophosphate kinase
MSDLDAIHENRLLSRWATLLPASPDKRGELHHADSELVALGDGRLLALNVDAVVEEVHTGLYDPFLAGLVAVIAALSDLAAVGAEALGVLLSVTLPEERTEAVQTEVARGAREACEAAGTFVLGGDTNEGKSLAVSCAAAGTVPEGSARMRVGAQPGDDLWVSGPLGAGSALAAHVLLGVPPSLYGPEAFRPQPRLREGVAIRGLASAGMDTSDGLVATLDQIARLNDVQVTVDGPLERLLDPRVEGVRQQLDLPALAFLAGHHGEFELVFTAPAVQAANVLRVSEALGGAFLRLGRIEEGSGLVMGGAELDTTALRNLLRDVGGDPGTYAAELVRLTKAYE